MIHSPAMKNGSRRAPKVRVASVASIVSAARVASVGVAWVVFLSGAVGMANGPVSPPPGQSAVASPALPAPSRESLTAAKKRASEAKQILIVEFSAEWCSPCKQFERDVLPLQSVRTALTRVHFVRFDAETEVGKEAARALHVEGYPTFVAIRTDGEIASVLEGAQTEAAFVRWLRLSATDFEPSARLLERLKHNPSDGEAMLLWALRLRQRGELTEAASWLDRARQEKTAPAEVTARADWELRRLRLKLLLPRQQLVEHLQAHPTGPHADEAVRALLRLGPVTGDAASRAALGRYLDQLLQPASAERVNQLIYRLLRAEASAEAERAAKYLLSLDGKSPYYLDTLAEVFHLRGDAKEALRLSSQALASAPKGSELLRQSLLQNHARTPTLGTRLTSGGEGEGGVEGEAVDAVFGFHVHRVAVRVGQNPPHRRRHHPVPVRIAEDHHPSTHHGIADQQAVIDPAQAATRLFFGVAPVLTDLSCRDVYHRMTAAPDRPFYGGLRAAPQLCCKGATCLHFVSC